MDVPGGAAGAGTATVKRRKRSAAERLRIVEETLVPGASVARVARSHGINANQVFAWRKLHLAGKLVGRQPGGIETSASRLLPVTISDAPQPPTADAALSVVAPASQPAQRSVSIHIQLPKAQLRVEGGVDLQVLRAVLECLLG